LSELMGWHIMTSIFVTAVVVGLYTIFGGLNAVVMTDVVQLVIMFVGGIAILILCFWELGGWNAMVSKISTIVLQVKSLFFLQKNFYHKAHKGGTKNSKKNKKQI